MKKNKRIEMLEKRIKEAEEATRLLLKNSSIKPHVEMRLDGCCVCGEVTYVYDGEIKRAEFRSFSATETEVVEDHHDYSIITVKNHFDIYRKKIRYLMLDKKSGQIVNVDKIYTAKDEENGTN